MYQVMAFIIDESHRDNSIGKEYTNMTKVKVLLDSIDKVKNFVNILIKFDCDFEISSSRYTIDTKSIMGIFSLDLSQPLDMIIHKDGDVSDILEAIKPYVVE